MKPLLTMLVAANMLIALCACSKSGEAPATAAQPANPPSPPPPTQAITPHPSDTPAASSQTGPGEGSTAIGGMVGHQEKDGANTGKAPAPTGGDAATGSK